MKFLRVLLILLSMTLVTYECAGHDQSTTDAKKAVQKKAAKKLSTYKLPNTFTPTNQQAADTFGWQMFFAYNWPALPGTRGLPDPNKKIGQPGTVVWETWKAPDEVFYPDGSQPPGWSTYGTKYPSECNYDPVNKPGLLIDRTAQASGGSMTDKNGNIVYYFISFNQPVFDFIYNNGYYNITGQQKMEGPVSYPSGTAEMKAAWRVITDKDTPAIKQRYFLRSMYVYTPGNLNSSGNPTCEYKEMALVGLHFNLKVTYTNNKGAQWLMATFEQVDNVPPFGTPYQPGPPNPDVSYSLFTHACTGITAPCPRDQSKTAPCYNWGTEDAQCPRLWSEPANAIRTMNIESAARALNPQMQQTLRQTVPDSPWQYYAMITTQYPADPSQQPLGNPTPPTSANTTMETYVRPSSCIGCHHNANDITNKYFADYSFMLAQACPKPLFGNIEPTAACPKKTQK